MNSGPRLVLASASPRRIELLRRADFEFEIHPVDCDESWRADPSPRAYVRRLARAKAECAMHQLGLRPHAALPATHEATSSSTLPSVLILAADTTVWLAPDVPPLGKARDREEARAMLHALARVPVHRVTTAFCLLPCTANPSGVQAKHADADPGPNPDPIWLEDVTTEVAFRTLDDADIRRYLANDEWRDKAGAYAIQGRAAVFVEGIAGSYTNVVGLPLAQVVVALARFGCVPQ